MKGCSRRVSSVFGGIDALLTQVVFLPNPSLFDLVEAVGIPVFGPTALAARIEGSKAFAKDFMARNNIPTASYRTFESSQHKEALQYVIDRGFQNIVLKASGLAAGKGVLLPETMEEAESGLRKILVDKAFGDAGIVH